MKLTDSTGGTLSGVDTLFKAIDGNEIFLYSDPSNPDIVLGREGSGGVANPNGTVAFALLLQPTSGGATIWVVQYEALTNTNPSVGEDANTLNLANLVYVSGSSSSTSSFNIGTKNPGQNYWLAFTSSSGTSSVLVTGLDASSANPDTVNTSSTGDGSNSQSITPGGPYASISCRASRAATPRTRRSSPTARSTVWFTSKEQERASTSAR
ncbi:hypothetical protein ACVOMV_37060 [Mesorhizobium atlanticum]